MEYVQRLNQFAAVRTWRIDQDGLSWSDIEGEGGQIAFSAITAIRLRFEPSRAEQRRYAMRITAGREYLVTNINYRGIMDFEDQSSEFQKFVTALHEQLHAVNPAVDYKSGSTPGAYLGNLVMTLLVLVILAVAALFFLSMGMIWVVAVKLIFIVFYLPTTFKLLKRNRPGAYNPSSIPATLLPV